MAFVSFARAMQKPKFLKAAKAAGLRGETQMARRITAEAKGNHTWAKYAPPTATTNGVPRVGGELKVDITAAKTAHLALS